MKEKIITYLVLVGITSGSWFLAHNAVSEIRDSVRYDFNTCQEWVDKTSFCVTAGGDRILCEDHHDPRNQEGL